MCSTALRERREYLNSLLMATTLLDIVIDKFIHTLADIQSKHIGAGTHLWQFVVILADARIGRDCNICLHCLIENDVVIGDRITVKSGVQLCDDLCVVDDVFIGPNVIFTNEKFPRSKQYPEYFAQTIVMNVASIRGGGDIAKHKNWRTYHGGRWGGRHAFVTRECHRRVQHFVHCRVSGE